MKCTISFIIETTLSGKYLVKYIQKAKNNGFEVVLVYLFLENPKTNISRVASRVVAGGHNVPKDDIMRRYQMTKQNNMSESDMIQMIGNDAVRRAQRENLKNGIQNVYSKNGVLYFQLPDGTITMDNPFEKGELKRRLDTLIAAPGN